MVQIESRTRNKEEQYTGIGTFTLYGCVRCFRYHYLVSNIALLQEQQLSVVTSSDVAYFPTFEPEDFVSQLNTVFYAGSSIAYVLNWVGIVMLLRPYIQRLGQIKFWAIMDVVMVYYLASFPLFVLGYFNPAAETDVDVMNSILIFSVGAVLSGILFGGGTFVYSKNPER